MLTPVRQHGVKSLMRPRLRASRRNRSAGPARDAARLVRSLMIARLVTFGPSIGLPIAVAVMVVTGLALAIATGKTGVFLAVPHVLPPALGFAAAGWFGLPVIDGRIADLANDVVDPEMCAPLIEILNGLPIRRHRERIEQGLALSLATVTPEWWDTHARTLRDPVKQALAAIGTSELLKPSDGPWLPALLEAIARCGRTELLRDVESVLKARPSPNEVLGAAAQQCAGILRERIRRDHEAATLLRPAPPPVESLLLRPARGAGDPSGSALLRPAGAAVGPSGHMDEPGHPEVSETTTETQRASSVHVGGAT